MKLAEKAGVANLVSHPLEVEDRKIKAPVRRA
jgi:hypothetical protein